jgi:peptidoglycan/xylan/chitin deacetylase (PgdA/CDA1 family)
MRQWRYHVPILGYHRVGPFVGDHVPTVTPEIFERQLRFLARFRYRVISLDEVVNCLERGEAIPRRRVVITFDDGYEETHRIAWPLLKRFGFPAATFLTPDEVGRPGFVTWAQAAEMARDGMTIGSHTMTHTYLPLLQGEQLAGEVIESKRVIEARLGRAVAYFSYPVGGFSAEIQELVRRAGYRAACTTNRAWPRGAMDRFALRRVKITERDHHLLVFWAKISGYYDAFRRLEQPA